MTISMLAIGTYLIGIPDEVDNTTIKSNHNTPSTVKLKKQESSTVSVNIEKKVDSEDYKDRIADDDDDVDVDVDVEEDSEEEDDGYEEDLSESKDVEGNF